MGTTALITGASAGIGLELARVHAEHGGDAILVARRGDRLSELKAELEGRHGVKVAVFAKDLTLPGAPHELVEAIDRAGLSVDYLINNAGFGGHGKFHERELASDLAMIQLNIVTLTALTGLFLPRFVARDRGRILNVSSVASLAPGPMQAVYFASKAYVSSFSNALVEELRGSSVTVTALLPGATHTEFGQVSGLDETKVFKWAASARRVAEEGYRGMLGGDLQVLAGLNPALKAVAAFVPIVPKRLIMRPIRYLQERQ